MSNDVKWFKPATLVFKSSVKRILKNLNSKKF